MQLDENNNIILFIQWTVSLFCLVRVVWYVKYMDEKKIANWIDFFLDSDAMQLMPQIKTSNLP